MSTGAGSRVKIESISCLLKFSRVHPNFPSLIEIEHFSFPKVQIKLLHFLFFNSVDPEPLSQIIGNVIDWLQFPSPSRRMESVERNLKIKLVSIIRRFDASKRNLWVGSHLIFCNIFLEGTTACVFCCVFLPVLQFSVM